MRGVMASSFGEIRWIRRAGVNRRIREVHKAESMGSGKIAVWGRGSIREFRRGEILAPDSSR